MPIILSAISIFLAALFSSSCSEKRMSSQVSAMAQDQKESSDQQKPEANEPIMVAGGFLTCQVIDDERSQLDDDEVIAVVGCQLKDQQNQTLQVANPDKVTFTTFAQNGTPSKVSVLSIDHEQGTQWYLAMTVIASPWLIVAELIDGQIFEAEIDPGSLLSDDSPSIEFGPNRSINVEFSLGPEIVLNGSFNTPAVVNPQFSDDSKAWGHYDPTAVTGWQAEWNNNSCGNNVRLEIQRRFQDGNQFTDLAGSCQFGVTPPPGGSNLRLSQTLATTAGSMYQISFSYMIQNANSAIFRVEGPAGVLFDTTELDALRQGSWQEVTLQFIADGDTSQISFSESGSDPLTGTLLDNVSVKEMRRQLVE